MSFKPLLLSLLIYVCSIASIQAQTLLINEILSSNETGITDAYNDHSDWIEIYNSSSNTINLQGYYLSDNTDNPRMWSFPSVSIAPNGFLLVFASGEESVGNQLHANFKLSKGGEDVLLSDPNGQLLDQFDSIPMRTDLSYGRKPNGGSDLYFFNDPTPASSNISGTFNGFIEEPIISKESGFYTESLNVDISHDDIDVVIRYTTDGTEPNSTSSIYYNSFEFNDNASQDNGISMIPTNPSFNYPQPGFTESRANNRGWLEPYGKVNKANILKVKAFKTSYLPSETSTRTYFINSQGADRYSLPVISLLGDPDDFFDDEKGIYVYGTVGEEGNYKEKGEDWERNVLLQLFEEDGELSKEQALGIRIHGGGGRHSTLKNLRIYARDEYGKSEFKYKWFNNDETNEFYRFLVRGPGHRPDCAFRDDLAGLLIENFDMDIQHVKHVIVFLNGEYWGIHTIKERFDTKYLEYKYGKDEDKYVILKNSGTLDVGQESDLDIYYNLLDFVEENNMDLPANYNYVKSLIDMDNYLSYYTSEVYLGNGDWVDLNIKFWRYKGFDGSSDITGELDGKWRWFMYDFDGAFGGSCDRVSYSLNMLDNTFDPDYGRATRLAIALRTSEQWRSDFVNKMCDLMNSSFNQRNFAHKMDQFFNELNPEILEHTERWRYPSVSETLNARQYEIPSLTKWNQNYDEFIEFKENRKRKIIGHMQEELYVEDTINVILNVNDKDMGNVQINSILISDALDGITPNVFPWQGTYFEDVDIPLIAVPKLGYRFVEWQESGDTQDTIIINSHGDVSYTAVFEEDPDFEFEDALFINEMMAVNGSTIEDEFGSNSDWIEIYNPNNKEVDIASYYISDNADDPYKYQFPRGSSSTIIPALGYKLIWANGRSERGAMQTNFKLGSNNEDIVLLAPDSSLIDNISYNKQEEDISFGREKDGDAAWKFFQSPIHPTPGKTNNNASIGEYPGQRQVSVYPNPVAQGKFVYFSDVMDIEVYNSTGILLYKQDRAIKINTRGLNSGLYFIKSQQSGILKFIVE